MGYLEKVCSAKDGAAQALQGRTCRRLSKDNLQWPANAGLPQYFQERITESLAGEVDAFLDVAFQAVEHFVHAFLFEGTKLAVRQNFFGTIFA